MGFSPTDTTNLCLCLTPDGTLYTDSGRTTPVTADGDAVGSASDSSADSNHFGQSTGGSRPAYKTGVFPSGKPSIRTNGSTPTILQLAHASASANLKSAESGSHTAFFVLSPAASGNGTFPCFFSKTGGGSGRFFLMDYGGFLVNYETTYGCAPNGGVSSTLAAGTAYLACRTYDSVAGVESWWVNGRRVSKHTTALSASNTTAPFEIGAAGEAAVFGFAGDFGPILIYTGVKSRKQILDTFAELATWAGVSLDSSDGSVRFVTCGNSIAFGSNSTANADGWAKQILDQLGKNYESLNWGVGGQTASNIVTVRTKRELNTRKASTRSIFLYEPAVNDLLGSVDGPTCEGYAHTTCSAAQAAGFKVVVLTVPVSSSFSGTPETNRQNYNTLVRSNYTGYADVLADVAADPTLNNPTNSLHPNDTLHGVWATVIKNAIVAASLIPTSALTITGPSSGASGVASTTFTFALPTGETFDGDAYVTLTPVDGTVTATAASGTIAGNGSGNVTVTPAPGTSSFTATYTPASGGSKSVAVGNGQAWAAQTIAYTAASGGTSSRLISKGVFSF